MHLSAAPVQVPEYAIQLASTVLLLVGWKWVFGAIQLALTLYNMRAIGRSEARTDVTEIFRQLPHVKRVKLFKLFFCLACFIYCIFRCAQAAKCCTCFFSNLPASCTCCTQR